MKRLSASLGAMTLIALTAGCAAQGEYTSEARAEAQNNSDRLHAGTEYDQANRKYQSGDFDSALKSIEKSISFESSVAKSHLLRARILIEMGDYSGALYSLDTGSDLDLDNHEYPYLMGVVYEQLKQFDLACEVYEAALKIKPHDSASRLALAEVFIQLNRNEDAKSILKASPGWTDGEAGFRQTLGHIARLEGNDDEALREFQKAAILSPNDSGILEDLFRSQAEAGDFSEAIRTVRELVDRPYYEQRPDLQRLHARCLLQTRQPVEARTILKALTRESGTATGFETWHLMADVAMLLKDDRLLGQAGEHMARTDPSRSEGFVAQAVSHRRVGNLEAALRNARLAMERAGDDTTSSRLEKLILDEIGAKSAEPSDN
ncbi:MAG: putative Zn-dependent protease [Planctomycetota bacterium]|jgi:predicted Zn-dependent protease